jgi:23S rRNA (uracil1939-C5)-methyltransferase
MGRTADGALLARVLPGEDVELSDDGSIRIVTPSADRVSPPCRHFRSCGGCAMQHASDASVAVWKQEIVRRALVAQRLDAPFRGIMTSPPLSRRRARFAGRRTKKGTLVGFHGKGSDTVIDVPGCQLLSPGLQAALPALHAIVALGASRKSELGLTVTESRSGPDVHVETDLPLTDSLRVSLAALANTHRLARLVWRDEPVATIAPPYQYFGTARVVPPPGAFLQATRDGEAALLAAVNDVVGRAARVVDLFAGCGTFSLPLAAASEVHAVEGEAAMVAALDRGWRETPGLKRVTTEVRDLFRRPLEPDELRHFDVAVIDPPRAGAEAQSTALAKSDLRRIAMVSCNPITFARDARLLTEGGFVLDWIEVIDQFRWSAHVEISAAFTRS